MISNIEMRNISDLLLDEENPRLPESVERDQQAMLDHIAKTTSIEELMLAIGENGYFPGEPLIAVPHLSVNGKLTIVEGNRRLTALRLLQDANNCTEPGSRMCEISVEAKHKPTEVPVVIQSKRADILPHLGFRHITGIKQWEPLAKARYLEKLFLNTDKNKLPRERYNEVARAIGSRRDYIRRNLDALAVFKEIKDKDFYEIDGLSDVSIKFSVLSTALADEKIGVFVGILKENKDGDYESSDSIINSNSINKKEVEELITWLFKKDEKGKTRVAESRKIRELGAVVANPKALNSFRANAPLKIAYQMTSDSGQNFIEYLFTAEGSLNEAAGMVATIDFNEDGLEVVRRILDTIKMIGRELKNKKKDDDEF